MEEEERRDEEEKIEMKEDNGGGGGGGGGKGCPLWPSTTPPPPRGRRRGVRIHVGRVAHVRQKAGASSTSLVVVVADRLFGSHCVFALVCFAGGLDCLLRCCVSAICCCLSAALFHCHACVTLPGKMHSEKEDDGKEQLDVSVSKP